MRRTPWQLGPGAVAAGGDIHGPVTVTNLLRGADDPLATAVPTAARMNRLARRLDLERFTGRHTLLDQIETAVQASERGYVVIQGEAGVGKTALAAHLVSIQRCFYHFTWFGRSPEQARRSLAAQLILGWGLHDDLLAPGGQFPHGADDPWWLVDVLDRVAEERDRRAAAAGEAPGPIVLVVDGLDEADPPAPGRDTGIPLGLPRPEHLPDGVFLVLTSRFGISLSGARDPATLWRSIAVTGVENLDDVHRYLTATVSGEHPDPQIRGALEHHQVDTDWFVATLEQATGGVWMYLRYVLDDLRAGRRSPADIAGLPAGLAGYYLAQIERWTRDTDDWATVGSPVLAALAALRRPATAVELAELPGLVDNTGQRAVTVWLRERLRPFLDPVGEGYQVRHQSLRDLFEERADQGMDTEDETARLLRADLRAALREAHRPIATRLTCELAAPDPEAADVGYAREHLPRHAVGAGTVDGLFSDPDLLLACAPAALVRCRGALASSGAHAGLDAYELSHQARAREPEHARWWLHVWARKTDAGELAGRCLPAGAVSVHVAWWRGSSHRALSGGHIGPVGAVCGLPGAGPGGATLLASAGYDGTVRLWDPATGAPVGDPLHGHDHAVNAVCALTGPGPGGATLLASASDDGTVRLWDPTAGAPVGDPLRGHDHAVNAVCALPGAGPGGATLLASASYDRAVLVWHIPGGEADVQQRGPYQ